LEMRVKIMKFVHIADLHMGQSFQSASFGGRFGSIKRQAIKENLRKVIEFCNEESIDFLLMAGDCIEADYIQVNDLFDLKYLFEQLIKTRVIMIAGNHDPAIIMRSKIRTLQWPKHVYMVDKDYEYIEFLDENMGFFCSSWQNNNEVNFDYELLDKTLKDAKVSQVIGVIHGDVYSDHGYMHLDKNRLLNSKLNYIALGHIHKADLFNGKMAYPGSLEPLDFSETGDHGFIVGSLDTSGIRIQHIQQMIHPMKVHKFDVSPFTSGMEILDAIKRELEDFDTNDMLRLILIGEMDLTLNLLEGLIHGDWSSIANPSISYLEVVDQTRRAIDIDQIYEEHKEDIIGYFIQALQDKGLGDKAHQEALELGIKLLLNEVK